MIYKFNPVIFTKPVDVQTQFQLFRPREPQFNFLTCTETKRIGERLYYWKTLESGFNTSFGFNGFES